MLLPIISACYLKPIQLALKQSVSQINFCANDNLSAKNSRRAQLGSAKYKMCM